MAQNDRFHKVIYPILPSNIPYITDQYIIYYRPIYNILLFETIGIEL